jgi:hypothetical protein
MTIGDSGACRSPILVHADHQNLQAVQRVLDKLADMASE